MAPDLNIWGKQVSGDRPVYTPKAHVCIFTVLTFPLWVSFQYHLLVYFDLITINTDLDPLLALSYWLVPSKAALKGKSSHGVCTRPVI